MRDRPGPKTKSATPQREELPQPPLRTVVNYVECSGTMALDCGHIQGKRPGATHPKRARCPTCLPLEERRLYLRAQSRTAAAARAHRVI